MVLVVIAIDQNSLVFVGLEVRDDSDALDSDCAFDGDRGWRFENVL